MSSVTVSRGLFWFDSFWLNLLIIYSVPDSGGSIQVIVTHFFPSLFLRRLCWSFPSRESQSSLHLNQTDIYHHMETQWPLSSHDHCLCCPSASSHQPRQTRPRAHGPLSHRTCPPSLKMSDRQPLGPLSPWRTVLKSFHFDQVLSNHSWHVQLRAITQNCLECQTTLMSRHCLICYPLTYSISTDRT